MLGDSCPAPCASTCGQHTRARAHALAHTPDAGRRPRPLQARVLGHRKQHPLPRQALVRHPLQRQVALSVLQRGGKRGWMSVECECGGQGGTRVLWLCAFCCACCREKGNLLLPDAALGRLSYVAQGQPLSNPPFFRPPASLQPAHLLPWRGRVQRQVHHGRLGRRPLAAAHHRQPRHAGRQAAEEPRVAAQPTHEGWAF